MCAFDHIRKVYINHLQSFALIRKLYMKHSHKSYAPRLYCYMRRLFSMFSNIFEFRENTKHTHTHTRLLDSFGILVGAQELMPF